MHKHLFISIAFIVIMADVGIASDPYTPVIRDPVNESIFWTEFREMNNMEFNCMSVDETGRMWFGGRGVVASLDHEKWSYYWQSDPRSKDQALSICPANDSQVYCGFDSALYLLEKGTWQRIIPVKENHVCQINLVRKFSDGSIWIASDKGLFTFRDSILFYYTTPEIGREFKHLVPDARISYFRDPFPNGFNVFSVCEGRDDEVWFALESKEIVRISGQDPTGSVKVWRNLDREIGVSTNMPIAMMRAMDGKIWVASSQSNRPIHIFDPESGAWSSVYLNKMFGGDETHNSIIQTSNGKIWIGGTNRLFTFCQGRWKQYTNYTTPLPSGRIVLQESKDGSVWLGGKHNQIYRLDYTRNRWNIYTGLNYQCGTAVRDSWFISSRKKAIVHNRATDQWTAYGVDDGLIENPMVLLAASDGLIWAAGSHYSLAATAYFDGKRWIRQSYPELGWCIHPKNFFEASDGSIWMAAFSTIIQGGFKGGIVNIRIDPDKELTRVHYTADEIGRVDVMGITQSKDGMLWTAGLFVETFDGRQWKKITDPPELAKGWLDGIQCDRDGGIWVANEGVGLFYLPEPDGEWRKFTVQDGLVNNTVLSLLPMEDHTLLAATEEGISRFDGQTWLTLAFPESLRFRRDAGILRKSPGGSVWINIHTVPWLNRVFGPTSPEEEAFIAENFRTIQYIPENTAPHTQILVAPDKVSNSGNIFIQWEGSDYLHQTPANQIQYSYRLDDESWSPFSYNTEKLYFSLGPGTHTFELRARDNDLNIENQVQAHVFTVSPPTWMQPWFIFLMTILTAIIVILMVYLYKKKIYIHDMEVARVMELDKMKIRYFTNLSHDLRTPLNLILGPLSDLIEAAKSKKSKKRLQQYELMQRNAIRLDNLVNKIIDFRKLDNGDIEYSPSTGLILSFVRNIFNSFKMMAIKRNITFRLVTEVKDLNASFDHIKLETVLYNLLSNAFKFTPSGGNINLKVNHFHKDDGEELEVIVEDNGPGIPGDKIDSVFERYIQLNSVKYGNEPSSGLGLAVSKELMDICGGSISAQNRTGEGARFIVRIPFQTVQVSQDPYMPNNELFSLAGEKDEGDTNSGDQKEIILVVEDMEDERDYLVSKLSGHFDVIYASNGEEGYHRAKEMIPDLIISDIQMPRMDGFEFCRHIRADKVTSHIPFIFLTGSQLEKVEMEGFLVGADAYISKPYKFSLLVAQVNSIFANQHKRHKKFDEDFGFDTSELSVKDNELVTRAKKIVHAHIDDDQFDVSVLCNEIGMSRTQLFRKFKSLANITPQTFIRRIRLQKAAYMLLNTQLNITEICYSLGYKYPGHFTQHFKNEFKMTPKEYQMSRKAENF